MTEMEERIARAIYAALDQEHEDMHAYVGGYEPEGTLVDGSVNLILLARAALEALREPTEEMAGRGESRLARAMEALEEALAALYEHDAPLVGRLCDEKFDRSGGLLGRVRDRRARLTR